MNRRFDFSSAGPLRSQSLAPASVPDYSEPELPRAQVIALLQMRVPKAGEDSLYAKVLAYLKAVDSDEPDGADYTALCEARYIYHNGIIGRYQLLPPGQHAAERHAREIAKQCGIHHITFGAKLPRSNMGPTASCSCGHFRIHATRNNEHTLPRRAAVHIEAVKNGTWKKPRPIAEFLNEVMPLQLPFERRT